VQSTPRLTLVDIDNSNWRSALGVRVTPDQVRFVADFQPVALVSLAKAYVRPGGLVWKPLAILNHGDMVGLVTVAHAVDAVDAVECELFHFVIDGDWQRKGLGRMAMTLIIDYVKRTLPACRSVALTVDIDNAVARRLYESMGFRPTGLERAGDPLYRLQL